MKKLLFTLIAFTAFTAISNARSITDANSISEEMAKVEIKFSLIEGDAPTNVCCTRRGKASNGQSVVITACVKSTGDSAVDMGNACAKAVEFVNANIQALEELEP